MTAPTTTHVKNAVIKLDNYAASLTAITGTSSTFGMERKHETDGSTTLSDRAESHTIGMVDNGACAINAPYSTTQFRHMAGIYGASTTQTLEQDWAGTATGRRKGSAETVMSAFELDVDMGATSKMMTEHTLSGAVTFADN